MAIVQLLLEKWDDQGVITKTEIFGRYNTEAKPINCMKN